MAQILEGGRDEADGEQAAAFHEVASAHVAKAGGSAPAAAQVDASAEHSDCWIPWQADAPAGQGHRAPRTIYHAFHRSFADVAKMVPELRQMGFDSVQISPAQKSKDGHEWWARYQPKDYDVIEGYGTVEALSQLCRCAREHSMIVIADVVFNHMLVVASANEWEQAQRDESRLRALQLRLEKEVGPTFSAADFQWPWFKLYGHHWDNLSRYEGWGNGEWSELRHCSKVVSVHNRHLQILLDAGVRGFRFDAVKHMRVEHIAEYVIWLPHLCLCYS
ncbi:unnamed protein product [Prorocentrum cordatum]|uniref:alpha-amylase n=1 Tax=Prorocentrum cordatum TaxID=2364126 RepID=A0ABN9VUP9_9DINO|nr:unnamed protein product [Polarella glacialis]